MRRKIELIVDDHGLRMSSILEELIDVLRDNRYLRRIFLELRYTDELNSHTIDAEVLFR